MTQVIQGWNSTAILQAVRAPLPPVVAEVQTSFRTAVQTGYANTWTMLDHGKARVAEALGRDATSYAIADALRSGYLARAHVECKGGYYYRQRPVPFAAIFDQPEGFQVGFHGEHFARQAQFESPVPIQTTIQQTLIALGTDYGGASIPEFDWPLPGEWNLLNGFDTRKLHDPLAVGGVYVEHTDYQARHVMLRDLPLQVVEVVTLALFGALALRPCPIMGPQRKIPPRTFEALRAAGFYPEIYHLDGSPKGALHTAFVSRALGFAAPLREKEMV